jgi:HEAT repeat protein
MLCKQRALSLGRVIVSAAALTAVAFGQNEGSVKQRIERMRQLGKTDSQAMPVLTEYLKDRDREVRIEAVKAIVRIGGPSSLDPLVQATHDNDGDVQELATDGLVNFYLPGYVPKGLLTGPITRSFRDVKSLISNRNDQVIGPDITIRPSVAEALADEVLHAPSMDIRANAARAAGILRDRAALDALQQSLRTKDTALILESLIALQKIHDPAAGPSVSFLARDLDDRVQATALETIGALRSLDSAPDVRNAFKNARNKSLRRSALNALAMLGLAGDRPLFLQYASDRDDQLRAAAVEGLGRIREPEDTPLLQNAYNEPNIDWRIHLAAAYGLVSQGNVDTSDVGPLRFLIQNLDLKNRDTVSSAYLQELCRRDDVVGAIGKMINDVSSDQKVALCGILAEAHNPQGLPLLSSLTHDRNSEVALAAVRAQRVLQSPPH